jgi:pyruvate/2-oxoglutarate dehydrogenase complex dihydrolipoamide acyltransferase (E2) component
MRGFVPVFLDTDVDMTSVQEHRQAARQDGRRYSVVSYVLYTTARVLMAHPEANASVRGRLHPVLARYPTATGKLTLDRMLNGRRIVLAAVLPDLHRAGLEQIQQQVDHYRDGDPAEMAEFARARRLQRLPVPLGRLALRASLRSLARRPAMTGTFAVTSLGHTAVDGFHSVGGTTITVGLGRVTDRPVVRDGRLAVAPLMRLSLTFDHRVIDGAEAADVLTAVKEGLERFPVISTSTRNMVRTS